MPNKKSTQPMARAHAYFTGRVQGVGFRYTAEALALGLKLKGWVRNLPDGRVELVSEGPKQKIEELFLQIQKSALGPHIKKTDLSWEVPKNEFSDFTVEFFL